MGNSASVLKKGRLHESRVLIKEHGLRFFFKESLRFFFWKMVGPLRLHFFIIPKVITKIKKGAEAENDLDSTVDFGYSFNYFGLTIAPGQVKEEITQLLRILKDEVKPKRLMELGTNNGGTLFLLCQTVNVDSLIISLDLPGGQFGGGYPKWKEKLFKAFAKGSQTLNLITGNSHESSTLKVVEETLCGEKLDFLLVDGDHTCEGVKQDFVMYGQLVRKGGIIAFHDIVKNTQTANCDVTDFWNEIKTKYQNIEIIKDSNQGWGGIGVLFV